MPSFQIIKHNMAFPQQAKIYWCLEAQDKLSCEITFNRPVDPDTLYLHGTLTIDRQFFEQPENTNIFQPTEPFKDIAGTIQFSNNNKIAKWISNDTVTRMDNPYNHTRGSWTNRLTVFGSPNPTAKLIKLKAIPAPSVTLNTRNFFRDAKKKIGLINVVTDSNGIVLDGDGDGNPGGNFIEHIGPDGQFLP